MQYQRPNQSAYVDGPVVHHFERPGRRAGRPDSIHLRHNPIDTVKSIPLDWCELATEGGGAEGTPGYLRLEAHHAIQFYAESTPIWWVPGRLFDLRDTYATFYLKAIEPIAVAPGFLPRLFIASHMPHPHAPGAHLCNWYTKEPLVVGQGTWAYNEVFLSTDPDKWVNYTRNPPEETIARALSLCGYIGWSYKRGDDLYGADATGVMGWDEFRFNLKQSDLADLKAGRPLTNALEL